MDIIRAWKDAEYRRSLTAEELAALPENPAGMIELTDEDLGGISGAADPVVVAGTGIFDWGCTVVSCLTCGPRSCLGVCTANCSVITCPAPVPQPPHPE
jgi:mersacidin/lichenicidin family type 2 lantibiotic